MLSKKLQTNFTKIISLNSLLERTFHNDISVLCCYDPEGVVLKFVKGELLALISSRHFTTTTMLPLCLAGIFLFHRAAAACCLQFSIS